MKSILLVTISLFSLVTFATESQPKYQTMDLKQFDGVKAQTNSNTSNVKFTMNCKTDDGREVKSEDAGYMECLAKTKSKASNAGY